MRKRLALDRCRSLLPNDLAARLTDEDLESLLKDMYTVAEVVTEIYLQLEQAEGTESLLERAAIMEIDGGMDATAALAAALASIRTRDDDLPSFES